MDSSVPGLGNDDPQELNNTEATQPEATLPSASDDATPDASQDDTPVNAPDAEADPQPEMSSPAPEPDEAADEPAAESPADDVTPEAVATDEAEAASEAVAPSEPDASEAPVSQPDDAGQPKIKRGDVVEGTITATSPTQITVDIGADQPGVIPGDELEKMSKAMLDGLREGEKIHVFVVNLRDHQGNIRLSVNRALEEMDWRQAEEFRQSQEVYETRVAGYNKGGLIVRFGRVRGFVPQSQMSADRRRVTSGETPEERWSGMVNEAITVKVMEVDRARNRLILSERSATRESREKRKENLINQLRVGEKRPGRVVSLEDFGAFVDIGGAEGLVHLTELSWQHVTHPRELLTVGQEVQAEVISIDRDKKRIGLSLKSQEPDPWDSISASYNGGELVQAIVTKLTKFGAFARLVDVPEIEGLIHISELSDRRVVHPREVVQEGDKLTLRVVKVDIANRRLGLSLKKVNSPEYLDQDWSTSGSASGEAEASPSEAEPPSETDDEAN